MFNFDIINIIQLVIILVVSIGLHEYAHALTSYKLGDPTPQIQGRLTPNPIAHLDPMGSLMMLFMIISGRGIGWGKPVQINPSYYKDPIKGEFLVAIAGPLTNIFLGILGILILLIYGRIGGLALNDLILNQAHSFVIMFWNLFIFVNFSLAIFNLLPIPPLDGFSIIKVISSKTAYFIEKYQAYVSIFFLIIILGPLRNVIGSFIFGISEFLFKLFFGFFSGVLY